MILNFLIFLDDDDLDEDDIPGFSHPTLAQSPLPDKGKGRARELDQLAAPSGGGGASSPGLSGNIGSASGVPRPARQTVGGVQVETRCVYMYISFEIDYDFL